MTEESKLKISKTKKAQHIIPPNVFKKGQKAWNKGMKCYWTTERNLTDNPGKKGEEHWKWYGDEVGYSGIHKWIVKQRGNPDTCEDCGKTGLSFHQIHWANISREYKRDVSDWKRLCAKCHKNFDRK